MNQNTGTDVSDVDLRERNILTEAQQSLEVKIEIDDALKKRLEQRERMDFLKIDDIKVGYEVSYGRIGYKHHAVVVSIDKRDDVYEIIHLSGDSSDSFMASSSSGDGKASPIRSSKTMAETLRQRSYCYKYDKHLDLDKTEPDNQKKLSFDSKVIVERAGALLRVFKSIKKLDYHLQKFNCQHFASYCVTGFPFCKKYRKDMCGFDRGLDVNEDAKVTLDAKLKQHFERQLEGNFPETTNEKKQSNRMDQTYTSNKMIQNTTR